MASTYKDPKNYLAWIIRGDDLGIITSRHNESNNPNNEYVAIDESVTDGILVNYTAEPDAVTTITDYPDVDNVIHLSIVDYVKARLYLDRAGKEPDPNKSIISERLSQMHERRWNDAVKRFGSKKRSKIGGSKIFIGKDFR